ncbi:MAG TPA: alpha-D-ribose 1-methylphosphonate 5-triphosphate diphosphatase [Paracoccaceae bacterium]|nr:alpha-D-ribose 1-methylphosphonate 5-triphosphate diphosphatase [Paracoccaceae bacterium]
MSTAPMPAPPGELALTNARLVLAGETLPGTLLVRDGLIAAIDQGPSSLPSAVDCAGQHLIPGLVELHTDNLERHMQPRPGVHWPLAPAIIAHDAELASVGITTVFDALRVGSVVSDERARYGKYARELATELIRLRSEGALRIAHFLHLRAEICSETLLEELDEFGPADRIGIVSLMDHTPGQRQFRDPAALEDFLRSRHGMSREEMEAHFAHLIGLREDVGAAHEAGAVARARALGATLASHDDTTAEHVAISATHGARLAEFPTTLEAARACRTHGIAVMMGAPNLLRGGSHSGNVAASVLAAEGLLDILSSDYAPSALLMGAVRLGQEAGNLAQGIATVTRNPARAVGLADRGEIAPGLRADLALVSLAHGYPVTRGLWRLGQRVA